ncbi:MAG: penicillin acylase family protein [Chloroflexi bacterium]|nr:penicillin acylase family protein [Chloroflexota bacterium]
MERARHIGNGTYQLLTGKTPGGMRSDIFLRTLGLRRTAAREFNALSTDAQQTLTAFVVG